MWICEVLPPELCEMVWKFLPLRTRATATKAAYEEHYHTLVQGIPRIGDYTISLIRNNSTPYVFGLLLNSKQEEWASLGRWKQWAGKYAGSYDDYFSFLRHVCRRSANHQCLLVLQEAEVGPKGGKRKRIRSRPKHTKNKRQEW